MGVVTFGCGYVAVRLGDDSFLKSLQRPQLEFGLTGKHLVMFMSGSVAVQLAGDSFFMMLLRLAQALGITGKDGVTVMKNSLAVRRDDDHPSKVLQWPKQCPA